VKPLPLRLTPYEQSLWVDDCPAYPWNILFRLGFAGRLDRAPLEESLRAVAARHPFLRARVRKRWTQRSYWELLAGDATQPLHWNEHRIGEWPTPRHLQSTGGESLEVWVRSEEAQSEVLLQFNHLAVDGVGASRVIDELLQFYAAAVAGNFSPELPKLEPQRLKRRGMYGYTMLGLLKLAPKLAVGLHGIRQLLGRKPVPLIPHEVPPRDEPLPASYPQLRAHTFTERDTATLRDSAKRAGATMNDLLTSELFLTLHAWRRRRGQIDETWLRLMVPVDMRKPEDATTPAADVVSSIFLDRLPSQADDPAALLRSIHDEMTLMKRNRLGLIYLIALWVTDLVPGLLTWLAKRQKFTCTAGFSNLVRPLENSPLPRDEAGDLHIGTATLRSLEFYPPLRPYTCVVYGAATYAGRLTLALNADPRFLSPSDADELLGEFVARVITPHGCD